MQTTQDGEYIPDKELDTTFKIPKKRKVQETIANPVKQPEQPQNTVLGDPNAYYDYQNICDLQQAAAFYAHYNAATSADTTNAVPITQTIYNALSEYKEEPKNRKRDIFKDTVPDFDDHSLPRELLLQFQPLYCKLCAAQLSSNVMAKMHYKSKNHEKKVRKFLIDYSERTGEPLHKRAKSMPNSKATTQEMNNDPRYFYCEICDLPLTGKIHAESHYMGKNHQKVLMGHKPPAGKGFYNEQGKWIRNHQTKVEIKNGEDTFGLAFRGHPVEIQPEMPSTSASKFRCEVCAISTTCQQQLDMHYKGQKHQKKLRQLNLPIVNVPAACAYQIQTPIISEVALLPVAPKEIDLSAYRTPSGQYYCQTCNLTLNSEPQFKVHLQSKNHLKKMTQQK